MTNPSLGVLKLGLSPNFTNLVKIGLAVSASNKRETLNIEIPIFSNTFQVPTLYVVQQD